MHPFLACFVFLVLASGMVGAKSPNIVLIMADDMGYECIARNGGTSYETPRIDALAETGIRFTHCFSTPICTPTRVQIMTGKYNFRNYSHFGYLNPQETTFAHLLKKAGYATCIAGKWQLNGIYHELAGHQDSRRPMAMGFDESCLWQVTQPRKTSERYADPLVEVNGKLQKRNGDYGPDIFCDFVCDFISRHKAETAKPFFCYYPMVLVHDPFVPTPDSPEWNNGDRHGKDKRFFADMVTYADKIVGRIVDQLEQAGIAENTLVIVTGDNGTHRSITTETSTGPVRGGKGFTIESGIHVPLFARWQGVSPQGVVCDDLIDFTDMLPTILNVAGVELDGTLTDGRSFAPQLRGKVGQPREHIFCHYDPRWGPMAKSPCRFVRDKRYKLYDDGRFYASVTDPLEQQSLSDDVARDVRRKLQAALDSMPAWRK